MSELSRQQVNGYAVLGLACALGFFLCLGLLLADIPAGSAIDPIAAATLPTVTR